MTHLPETERPLEQALARYFESVDRQEPLALSHLLAAFPDNAAQLRQFFEAEQRLHGNWQKLAAWSGELREVPTRLGRFEIERVLGSGAFGVVYLAADELLKRRVALKVPQPQMIGGEESRRRFEAEAAASARLHHRGIVSVYEADFSGPIPYIASAYCPGPDLGRWLAARGQPVPWAEAATFMAKLADAVDHAHREGVYHRDLKPSNVLLMPHDESVGASDKLSDYSPKLTDFGLAKCALLTDTQTRSSMMIGTPLYMAPEQLESARVESPIQADIYSLGCILYELTTGQPPISGETYTEILDRLRNERPRPLGELVPAASKDFATVCHKCLEKNPRTRFATAAELAADLRACADHRPISAVKSNWIERFQYWSTRPQRIYDAGLYALRVQLLIALWLSFAVLSALWQLVDADVGPRLVAELMAVNMFVHLPMALVGWQTTQRKPWAILTGLGLTVLNMLLPAIFISLDFPLFFADIYDKVDASGYFMGTTCVLVFLSELGQLFLYGVAWKAHKHSTRTR